MQNIKKFCADFEDENLKIGQGEKVIFLTFPHEKTIIQCPKVFSEAIIPTNCRYICIEKWSEIFVSAVGNAVYESEEKPKKICPHFSHFYFLFIPIFSGPCPLKRTIPPYLPLLISNQTTILCERITKTKTRQMAK